MRTSDPPNALARTPNEVRLKIVDGRIPDTGLVARSIERLGLQERVVLVRRMLTVEELVSEYSSARVALVPSYFEGFGFPASLGAQFGCPDKKVWSVVGDGGFQMTQAELATAAIHELPTKCLIINNNFLGMVRQWQELFFENRLSGVDLIGNPDFVKLAQAYGVKAWRIRRPADVDRVLAEAHAYNEGPCVVVAEVVKEDNVFPMIPSGAPLSGMIIEKPKGRLAKPTGST